tara:strand:- start:132 stop:869 length:738 start_codon:yes stop_codon:yes gene_type:complete
MTLLIDADWLIYSSCCACEQDTRWDENIHTLHLDKRDAIQLIEDRVAQYQLIGEASGPVIMCFSDYPTFRHGIYQEYKANRSGKRRPLGLSDIREQIAKDFHSISFDGLEGDDVMGLLATGGKYKDPIIVSPDKDMRGVPCTLLQSDDLELITRKKADRHWMIQTLSGDKTDNIEGLIGVGPVTAEKILGDSQTLEDMWEKVLQAYKKKKKSYADAIMTARLTRILRDGEYNHTSGEVQLWEPAL